MAARAQTAASAALLSTTWAHFRPGMFHAFDADVAVWARADILLTEGASTIGAVANSAAYTEGGPWLAEALGYLDGNRHSLRQALDELAPLVGYRAPDGTYLAWLDLRAALDARPGASHADDAPEWAQADPGDLERWIRRRTGVAGSSAPG